MQSCLPVFFATCSGGLTITLPLHGGMDDLSDYEDEFPDVRGV